MKETPQNTRLLMAVVLVAAGIFMLVAAPFLVQSTLDPIWMAW